MTRQFAEQRKLRQGLAKIGGATLAFSLILEVRQWNLPDFGSEKMASNSKHMRQQLSIEDDGIGFRPDTPTIPEGFGFSTMRRRASRIGAKFTLRTSPGTGTAIRISAPCPAWSYRL
jgi:two-component sensor histidine kinase